MLGTATRPAGSGPASSQAGAWDRRPPDQSHLLADPHADTDVSTSQQRRLAAYRGAGSPLQAYTLESAIGLGSSSVVRLARRNDTGELFACKVLHLEGGPEVAGVELEQGRATPRVARVDALREVDALCGTHGPGLLHLREYYEHEGTVYIITDLLRGRDLAAELAARGCLSEPEARSVFRVLLQATSRLQELGVLHRDLKPENLHLATPGDPGSVRVVDFGLACRLEEGRPAECCGTPGFTAPEVFAHHIPGSRLSGSFDGYGREVDMWSLGVVLYQLLCGRRPFTAPTVPEVLAKVASANYSLRGPGWERVSEPAQHLVRQLLKLDVHARYTPYDALAHPWMNTPDDDGPRRQPAATTSDNGSNDSDGENYTTTSS